ncbi:MAG: hypothetical protein ACREDC_01540, partial [Bradyrhizobium sp.]
MGSISGRDRIGLGLGRHKISQAGLLKQPIADGKLPNSSDDGYLIVNIPLGLLFVIVPILGHYRSIRGLFGLISWNKWVGSVMVIK